MELEQLLQEAITGELAGRVHVALPALVVSYDATKQTANVQPILRGRYRSADGTVTTPRLPQLTGVPVLYPQGGGFSIVWPLAEGDTVQLVINERSLDEWKGSPSSDVAPRDPRRFDLTDAVAFAGMASPGAALTEFSAGAMVLSGTMFLLGDKTASDFVALSSLTNTQLGNQRTATLSHTHASAFGPIIAPDTQGGPPGAAAATWPVIGSVACTRVKAK